MEWIRIPQFYMIVLHVALLKFYDCFYELMLSLNIMCTCFPLLLEISKVGTRRTYQPTCHPPSKASFIPPTQCSHPEFFQDELKWMLWIPSLNNIVILTLVVTIGTTEYNDLNKWVNAPVREYFNEGQLGNLKAAEA